MRKLLLLIALGFVMLSSCNGWAKKGDAEEIDSIALRAKTDTVLSFNGDTLGYTYIEELPDVDYDIVDTAYVKEATITAGKWTYPVTYWLNGGEVVKSVKKNHKIINTVKLNLIQVEVDMKIDSTDIRRIVKLYTSRYGKYSYFDANDGKSPIYFPNDKVDSLSRNFYLNTFICKREGKIVWEWANCSIAIEDCFITYSSSGAKDRLKEEKEFESKAKKQDI